MLKMGTKNRKPWMQRKPMKMSESMKCPRCTKGTMNLERGRGENDLHAHLQLPGKLLYVCHRLKCGAWLWLPDDSLCDRRAAVAHTKQKVDASDA